MTKRMEPTEETVVKTTEEITPETAVTTDTTTVEKIEPEVKPTRPKEDKTFKERLELAQITVGTKISYVVSGSEEPTEIVVDDAFLSLPIQDLEYYEKFNYKII